MWERPSSSFTGWIISFFPNWSHFISFIYVVTNRIHPKSNRREITPSSKCICGKCVSNEFSADKFVCVRQMFSAVLCAVKRVNSFGILSLYATAIVMNRSTISTCLLQTLNAFDEFRVGSRTRKIHSIHCISSDIIKVLRENCSELNGVTEKFPFFWFEWSGTIARR